MWLCVCLTGCASTSPRVFFLHCPEHATGVSPMSLCPLHSPHLLTGRRRRRGHVDGAKTNHKVTVSCPSIEAHPRVVVIRSWCAPKLKSTPIRSVLFLSFVQGHLLFFRSPLHLSVLSCLRDSRAEALQEVAAPIPGGPADGPIPMRETSLFCPFSPFRPPGGGCGACVLSGFRQSDSRLHHHDRVAMSSFFSFLLGGLSLIWLVSTSVACLFFLSASVHLSPPSPSPFRCGPPLRCAPLRVPLVPICMQLISLDGGDVHRGTAQRGRAGDTARRKATTAGTSRRPLPRLVLCAVGATPSPHPRHSQRGHLPGRSYFFFLPFFSVCAFRICRARYPWLAFRPPPHAHTDTHAQR